MTKHLATDKHSATAKYSATDKHSATPKHSVMTEGDKCGYGPTLEKSSGTLGNEERGTPRAIPNQTSLQFVAKLSCSV